MISKLRLRFWDWVWDSRVIYSFVPKGKHIAFSKWVIDKGEKAYARVHKCPCCGESGYDDPYDCSFCEDQGHDHSWDHDSNLEERDYRGLHPSDPG